MGHASEAAWELAPADARILSRLAVTQRWTAAAGVVLTLLGIGYAVWGVARFDPLGDPRLAPGFDRPIASLAFLYQGYQGVERIRAETTTEAILLETLIGGMKFGSGMVLMLLRLFLGTLVALTGCILMTVVVERRRLLSIITRLRE